jgi:hypothetical protein
MTSIRSKRLLKHGDYFKTSRAASLAAAKMFRLSAATVRCFLGILPPELSRAVVCSVAESRSTTRQRRCAACSPRGSPNAQSAIRPKRRSNIFIWCILRNSISLEFNPSCIETVAGATPLCALSRLHCLVQASYKLKFSFLTSNLMALARRHLILIPQPSAVPRKR